MIKQFLFLIFTTISIAVHAQSSKSNEDNFQKNDCDDRIFVRVEEPPILRVSTSDYADSISTYLKAKKAIPKDSVIIFRFVVTKKSEIYHVDKEMNTISKTKVIEDAIVRFADLWEPARQNTYIVCATMRVKFNFSNDKVEITLLTKNKTCQLELCKNPTRL